MNSIAKVFEGEIEKGGIYRGVIYSGSRKRGSVKLKCLSITPGDFRFEIARRFWFFSIATTVDITDMNPDDSSCNLRIGKKQYQDVSYIIKSNRMLKIIYNDNSRTRFFAVSKKENYLVIERTISGNYFKVVVNTGDHNPSITT